MPHRFRRIGLVGRMGTPGLAEPLARLAALLAARGHDLVTESETAQYATLPGAPAVDADQLGNDIDLAIVLGGDGTMLSIARRLALHNVPLIGVNLGRLGFLTDIPLASMEPAVEAILEGRYTEEARTLLAARIERPEGQTSSALALNDVVVNRGGSGTMIEYAVEIDGRFVYAMRADGIIVTTPTGSTAYALSAGGPILGSQIPAFALVPVAPHALTHRPIAIDDSCEIAVSVARGRDAAVHCDGQSHFELSEGDRVIMKRAPHRARFLHPEGYDYFAMLRRKLHWSETPERLGNNGAG